MHFLPRPARDRRKSLKIEREEAAGLNRFTAYGDGWVEVNGTRLTAGALVGAGELVARWGPPTIDRLEVAHVEAIVALAPEIVLLGTGRAFRFPHPALLAPLHEKRIGVEVMDTKAACRTYNILLAEGRRVVAAILVA
jgi:uncharacterized protein